MSSVSKPVSRSVFPCVHRPSNVPAALLGGERTTNATVGGIPLDQLASPLGVSTVDGSSGRMFLMDGCPITITGNLSAIKVKAGTATSCKVSVWRSGTKIWQSSTVSLTASSINTISVTGVSVLPDDVLGIWLPSGTLASVTYSGPTLRYATDADGSLSTVGSLATTSANTAIYLEAVAVKPMLAITGDSITEGHNNFHGPEHSTSQGGTLTAQPGYVAAKTANWGYRNYGLGSQTFAWVASTGAVNAFNSGATHVWIHCGVNDIALGRTWNQVLADLTTILGLKPSGVRLYLSEILPANIESGTNVATARTWNANLLAWCAANNVTLVACRNTMGQTRVTTGQLDDLKTAYNDDGLHLTQAGVNRLAYCFAPTAPTLTTAPSISGSTYNGFTLTATTGSTTSDDIATSWQWYADGAAISNATSSTYTLTSGELGKYITVKQTIQNAAGSSSATSSSVGPVTAPPAYTKVVLDGSTGYVTGTPSNIFNTGSSFTIAVTLESISNTGGYILSMGSTAMIVFFNGSSFAWGNGTGWCNFAHGGGAGAWRFVYDSSQTGFDRFRAFKDGAEVTRASTEGSFAAPAPSTGALQFGRRTSGSSYVPGTFSAIKTWSRVCTPNDSDQTTGLSLNLDTITGTTWDDTSSNNTDYTLTGGATPSI